MTSKKRCDIADLIEIAKVSTTDHPKAQAWLLPRVEHLRRMGKKQYFLPAEQQKKIAKARRRTRETKGLVDEIEVPRGRLASRWQKRSIQNALTRIDKWFAAMQPPPNRPPNVAVEIAVDVAFKFFELFSTVKPSGTRGGPFSRFCGVLCEIALDTKQGWTPASAIRRAIAGKKRAVDKCSSGVKSR